MATTEDAAWHVMCAGRTSLQQKLSPVVAGCVQEAGGSHVLITEKESESWRRPRVGFTFHSVRGEARNSSLLRGEGGVPEMHQRAGQPLRLRDWLILQIDSGRYPGLRWENPDRTVFRIPWKHAAKQNYIEEEDAALFKAWALYKGKFREGSSKADPSVWKTRLRCALNKSPDFQEVLESNPDSGEPYKLYRIVAETQERNYDVYGETSWSPKVEVPPSSPEEDHPLQIDFRADEHLDTEQQQPIRPKNEPSPTDTEAAGPLIVHDPHSHPREVDASERGTIVPPSSSDFWLHIRLYYHGRLVTEVTTRTAEGCRIVSQPFSRWEPDRHSPPLLEEISFPPPQELTGVLSHGVYQVLRKLLQHLDKGVLLWVAPEGVFIKRKCQARVYWSGPLALYGDRPNKLEREKTCKVLDTERFLRELELYMAQKGPEPQYQIQLCFGEEYPQSSGNTKKFIMAHVEPVFARELLENAKIKLQRKQPSSPPVL